MIQRHVHSGKCCGRKCCTALLKDATHYGSAAVAMFTVYMCIPQVAMQAAHKSGRI